MPLPDCAPTQVSRPDREQPSSNPALAAAAAALTSCSPTVLQSLEKLSAALRAANMGSTPLVWLLNCSADVTLSDLEAFAEFGHAIGPDKVCAQKYARDAGLQAVGTCQTCRGWARSSCNDQVPGSRLGHAKVGLHPDMWRWACHGTKHGVAQEHVGYAGIAHASVDVSCVHLDTCFVVHVLMPQTVLGLEVSLAVLTVLGAVSASTPQRW